MLSISERSGKGGGGQVSDRSFMGAKGWDRADSWACAGLILSPGSAQVMQAGKSGWVPLAHPQGSVNCNMPLPQLEAKHRGFRVRPDWSEGGGRLQVKRKAFSQLVFIITFKTAVPQQ